MSSEILPPHETPQHDCSYGTLLLKRRWERSLVFKECNSETLRQHGSHFETMNLMNTVPLYNFPADRKHEEEERLGSERDSFASNTEYIATSPARD